MSVWAAGIAQKPAAGMAQRDTGPSFEVATIRPGAPEEHARSLGWEGRRFTARYTTISQMVQFAYNLQAKQVVNGPPWLDTATYDIEAQAEAGEPSAAEFRVMMQHLLAERFGMKTHREPRTMSAYELVVAKGGAKLQTAKEQVQEEIPPGGAHSARAAQVDEGGGRARDDAGAGGGAAACRDRPTRGGSDGAGGGVRLFVYGDFGEAVL